MTAFVILRVTMEVGLENVEDILLVDDNPGDVRLIQEAFASSPLEPTIHTTNSQQEALDFLTQSEDSAAVWRPDLILLDWRLSKNTGEEVIQAAKSDKPEIPVVVMTGSKQGLQHIESSTPAADECIEKPTDPQEYIELLRACGVEQ